MPFIKITWGKILALSLLLDGLIEMRETLDEKEMQVNEISKDNFHLQFPEDPSEDWDNDDTFFILNIEESKQVSIGK